MNITEVKIHKLDSDNMKAYASITIDKQLVITGLKVIHGKNGYFVAMPSRKDEKEQDEKKKYKDIVFPITKEAREYIQARVLEEYEKGTYKEYKEEQDNKLDDIDSSELPF